MSFPTPSGSRNLLHFMRAFQYDVIRKSSLFGHICGFPKMTKAFQCNLVNKKSLVKKKLVLLLEKRSRGSLEICVTYLYSVLSSIMTLRCSVYFVFQKCYVEYIPMCYVL